MIRRLVSDYMWRPWVSTLRTLTVIPIWGNDTAHFCRTLLFFPYAGAIIAAILWLVWYGCGIVPSMPVDICALILLGTGIVITGGIHVDGFGDIADGIGARHNPEKMLQVMKDSRLGSFGVMAVVMLLLVKWRVYTFVFAGHPEAVFAAIIVARCVQALVLALIPYTPYKTNGMGGAFTCRGWLSWLTVLHSCAIMFAVGLLWGVEIWACSLAALCVSGCMLLWIWRYLRGITGDCVGAINETCEAVFLLSAVGCFSLLRG